MSAAPTPFSPGAVLAVVAVGVGAFLLFLYALGAGWHGDDPRDGQAHAAADGLNGYSGLVALLERRGQQVIVSRNRARLEQPGVVVLTPSAFASGEEVAEAIAARRHVGPTVVILSKWSAMPAENEPRLEAPPGWVMLGDASAPDWLDTLPGFVGAEASLAARGSWRGLGLAGRLPAPRQAAGIDGGELDAIVRDPSGRALAAFGRDDPTLEPVLVIAEPDLVNNYGLADLTRARLAVALIDAAMVGGKVPVVFDLTMVGLGQGENLLTLAFAPPFLAATLCLLLAALLVAWRAFRRFGPPFAEPPAMALGKRQLARNGAGLIERARRLHLLGPPYAALLAARIAAKLGIRDSHPDSRDGAAARVLAARGLAADYPARLEALRGARRAHDLLRAAHALKIIERTLAP